MNPDDYDWDGFGDAEEGEEEEYDFEEDVPEEEEPSVYDSAEEGEPPPTSPRNDVEEEVYTESCRPGRAQRTGRYVDANGRIQQSSVRRGNLVDNVRSTNRPPTPRGGLDNAMFSSGGGGGPPDDPGGNGNGNISLPNNRPTSRKFKKNWPPGYQDGDSLFVI